MLNDKQINSLRKAVTRCRELLQQSIAELLEGTYGVYRTGKVEADVRMTNLVDDERLNVSRFWLTWSISRLRASRPRKRSSS